MPYVATKIISSPFATFQEGETVTKGRIPKDKWDAWVKIGLIVKGKGNKVEDSVVAGPELDDDDEVEDLTTIIDDEDDEDGEAPPPVTPTRRTTKRVTKK